MNDVTINREGSPEGLDIQVSTRKEIVTLFRITDGRIIDDGIFKGAPIYTPFYYSLLLDASSWEHEYMWEDEFKPVIGFQIENSHVGQFPELVKTVGEWCVLWMGQNRVYANVLKAEDFASLLEAYGVCKVIKKSKKQRKLEKRQKRQQRRKCHDEDGTTKDSK